jgi:hypothetical protein
MEAEIRKSIVPGQLGKIVCETPILVEKSWAQWCIPVIQATVRSLN